MNLGSLLAPRSVDDILAGRVRVSIGEVEYVLPVKTMHDQREWEAQLDHELAGLLRLVQNDVDDVSDLLRALSESTWPFIDLLLSYDDSDILPDRDTIDRTETEIGLLCALLEVWRAGHPKADIGLALFALRRLMNDPKWQGSSSSRSPSGDIPMPESRPN